MNQRMQRTIPEAVEPVSRFKVGDRVLNILHNSWPAGKVVAIQHAGVVRVEYADGIENWHQDWLEPSKPDRGEAAGTPMTCGILPDSDSS